MDDKRDRRAGPRSGLGPTRMKGRLNNRRLIGLQRTCPWFVPAQGPITRSAYNALMFGAEHWCCQLSSRSGLDSIAITMNKRLKRRNSGAYALLLSSVVRA